MGGNEFDGEAFLNYLTERVEVGIHAPSFIAKMFAMRVSTLCTTTNWIPRRHMLAAIDLQENFHG